MLQNEHYSKIRGFNKDTTQDILSAESKLLYKMIEKELPTKKFIGYTTSFEKEKNFKEITKSKFETFFPELNPEVNYANNSLLIIPFTLTKLVEKIDVKTMVELITSTKSIFDIKTKMISDCSSYIPVQIYNEEKYLFSNIYISKDYTVSLIAAYAHEITHALTLRNKGIIRDFLDDEFLSIFIEMLMVKDDEMKLNLNIYNRWIGIRRRNTTQLFSNEPNQVKEYYKSTVLAIFLFSMYNEMTANNQLVLLNQVKEVLNGNVYLHDFLEIYNLRMTNKEVIESSIYSIEKSKVSLPSVKKYGSC